MVPPAPQLIPPPETVPAPVPAVLTVSGDVILVNAALTACAAFIVSVQVELPAQSPDHPLNAELALGVAVNVTVVPARTSCMHPAPLIMQSPTPLLPDTSPVPVPLSMTVRS
jgi:hypothetical protein